MATRTEPDVAQVAQLLATAAEKSKDAAMHLSDVVDLAKGEEVRDIADEPTGIWPEVEDAQRLLGMAYSARYDAECALESAGLAVRELLTVLHGSEDDRHIRENPLPSGGGS